ncbi:CLUMA_CG013052, isoform A [Clunio marinus]|uniref:CLUMA_CG013052, isoform A n=1 Tax=Clunio marinus TaxID=568069 RepID=A0A1J1IJF3_9DIPT|nr:CLUMA_CG013052, isoform A [Clunio marinus]
MAMISVIVIVIILTSNVIVNVVAVTNGILLDGPGDAKCDEGVDVDVEEENCGVDAVAGSVVVLTRNEFAFVIGADDKVLFSALYNLKGFLCRIICSNFLVCYDSLGFLSAKNKTINSLDHHQNNFTPKIMEKNNDEQAFEL